MQERRADGGERKNEPRLLGFSLVAIAGKDRKARIPGIARIARGKLAEDERGAAVGFQATGVNAIDAEPWIRLRSPLGLNLFHTNRIAQTLCKASNGDRLRRRGRVSQDAEHVGSLTNSHATLLNFLWQIQDDTLSEPRVRALRRGLLSLARIFACPRRRATTRSTGETVRPIFGAEQTWGSARSTVAIARWHYRCSQPANLRIHCGNGAARRVRD